VIHLNKDQLIEILCYEIEEMVKRIQDLEYKQEHLIGYAIAATIIAIIGWLV